MRKFNHRYLILGILSAAAAQSTAVPIAPVNLDELDLGAKIVGPVGPEVESSFVDASGDAIADLKSNVSCPAGFVSCIPPGNPAGTVYTYIHEVTPGVDFPNDPPFPEPDNVVPFAGADSFGLNFAAAGFAGVAGYSFSQAADVLATGSIISVEQLTDNRLLWSLSADADWDTGDTLTLFWQTTQAPSGPGGQYVIGTAQTGSAAGPLPTPLATVPEPPSVALLAFAVLAVGYGVRVRSS